MFLHVDGSLNPGKITEETRTSSELDLDLDLGLGLDLDLGSALGLNIWFC